MNKSQLLDPCNACLICSLLKIGPRRRKRKMEANVTEFSSCSVWTGCWYAAVGHLRQCRGTERPVEESARGEGRDREGDDCHMNDQIGVQSGTSCIESD